MRILLVKTWASFQWGVRNHRPPPKSSVSGWPYSAYGFNMLSILFGYIFEGPSLWCWCDFNKSLHGPRILKPCTDYHQLFQMSSFCWILTFLRIINVFLDKIISATALAVRSCFLILYPCAQGLFSTVLRTPKIVHPTPRIVRPTLFLRAFCLLCFWSRIFWDCVANMASSCLQLGGQEPSIIDKNRSKNGSYLGH